MSLRVQLYYSLFYLGQTRLFESVESLYLASTLLYSAGFVHSFVDMRGRSLALLQKRLPLRFPRVPVFFCHPVQFFCKHFENIFVSHKTFAKLIFFLHLKHTFFFTSMLDNFQSASPSHFALALLLCTLLPHDDQLAKLFGLGLLVMCMMSPVCLCTCTRYKQTGDPLIKTLQPVTLTNQL